MLCKTLCALMLATFTGCSAFATYSYSDKITRDNLAQISQADDSALQLHDDDGDQRAFRDGVSRFGDSIVGKTLGDVVTNEKSAEQADNDKAVAAMKPAEREALLDAACQQVHTALMQEGQIEAGCTWNFPRGERKQASIVLHLFPAELDRSGLSKDDVITTAQMILAKEAAPNSAKVYSTKIISVIMN